MKHKIFVVLFFIAILPFVIFASMDLSYDFNPGRSLFAEPKAAPYSLSTSLKYITVTDGQPNEILASKRTPGLKDAEIVMVPWTAANDSNVNYFNLKSGVDLAFSRLTVGPVSIELNLGAGLNTVFEGFGGSNCVGFDGLYFYGLNASIYDIVQLKAGYHHFSGHWGDELNDKYYDVIKTYSDFDTKTYQTTEYTRDNSMLLGVSVTPASFIRVYGELEIPEKASWIHPVMHVPNDTIRPTDDARNQMEDLGNKYGIENIIKADNYHAYRIQAGVELEVPIYKNYSYFLSYDFQSHQDGQTMHNLTDYSADNPWEIENTISTGISMKHEVRDVKIEFTYHDGRFPLLNLYYQRTKYWSLGFNISG